MEEEVTSEVRLAHALQRWKLWPQSLELTDPPNVISSLQADASIQSNNSYLLSGGEHLMVARLQDASVAKLNLNPLTEWQAQHQAWKAGFAPEPLVLDIDHGLLVTRYVVADAGDRSNTAAAIASLLKSIHSLPGVDHTINVRSMSDYYKTLAGQSFAPVLGELQAHSATICKVETAAAALCHDPALCHNDLLSANRIPTREGLMAIDWEYTAMGDPAFDIAVVCAGDALDSNERQLLLTAYDTGDAQLNLRVELNTIIYRELELCWLMATEKTDIDGAIGLLGHLLDRMDTL